MAEGQQKSICKEDRIPTEIYQIRSVARWSILGMVDKLAC